MGKVWEHLSLQSTPTYLCRSTCCYEARNTEAAALCKRRDLVQLSAWHEEEGLTNEGRHHLLLQLSAWHESLHGHITRARLTVFWVGHVHHNSWKYTHPLLLGATSVDRPWAYFGKISVTGGKYRKHLTSERSHKQFTVNEKTRCGQVWGTEKLITIV